MALVGPAAARVRSLFFETWARQGGECPKNLRVFTSRERAEALPQGGTRGTVGLLLMRSYLLAGNGAHYDGVIAALESDATGQVLNVGTGTQTTVKQLAELLIDAVGAEVTPQFRPREVLVTQREADISRITEVLGWTPMVPIDTVVVPTLVSVSTPAIVAVMNVASEPPSTARMPKRARSPRRSGASPPMRTYEYVSRAPVR